MGFSTKLKFIKEKFTQASNEEIILSGKTIYAESAMVTYRTHPEFTGNTQVVDKFYVDSKITGSTSYDGVSPSNIEVGGMPSGTALSGRDANDILEEILVQYYNPYFTSFSIGGLPTEVGSTISGDHTASWASAHDENVIANSVAIRDITQGGVLATGLTSDGSESITLNTYTFTESNSSYTQQYRWRVTGESTIHNSYTRDYVRTVYQPWFWGKVTSTTRPTANQSLIDNGTKVIGSSSSNLTITFNSTNDDWLWFATPNSVAQKNYWYNTASNKGKIDGNVDPGGELFPDPDVVEIDDPNGLWDNIDYKIYISNWSTEVVGTMTMSVNELSLATVMCTVEQLQNQINC